VNSCDPYTWINGETYTEDNNTATFTLTNMLGCDSIINLNLDILTTTSIDSVTECESFTWMDGVTYTEDNNTATFTLTNMLGCDSVINLNLNLLQPPIYSDSIIACDSYTWIDGITYTDNTNNATFMLIDNNGCDSLINLNLTIIDNNPTVISNSESILSLSTNVLYQWLDCSNGFSEIIGETNSIFSPSINGNYAVEITDNLCADTSECITINSVGITENSILENVIIHPNPSSGSITVEFESIQEVDITMYNLSGQVVYSQENINAISHQFEVNEPSGIYILEISSAEGKQYYKVVLE
jgi:hypothetical protein